MSIRIVVLLLALAGIALAVEPCQELFECNSGPQNYWLGLNPSGDTYGQGQSFSPNCGSRLEIVSFSVSWGTPVGDVRSLAFGDTLHVSILDAGRTELARADWVIDAASGSRLATFDFRPVDLLLPIGDYIAVCWTDAPACGGIKYYTSDVMPGSRYTSVSPADPMSWLAAVGEATHSIVLDSDVTPAETASWSTIKASYR